VGQDKNLFKELELSGAVLRNVLVSLYQQLDDKLTSDDHAAGVAAQSLSV